MSIEANRTLAKRAHDEVFNGDDLSVADEICAPDFVWHSPGVPPDLPRGPEAVKLFATMLRSAFPDFRIVILDSVAEGDRVVNRWECACGTHKGEFMGVAGTGKEVTVSGIDIFRIADGKLAELWQEVDMLGLLRAIGAVQA